MEKALSHTFTYLKKGLQHTKTCRFTLQSSQLINNLSTQGRWVWCEISTFISIFCIVGQVTVRLTNGIDRLHGRVILTAVGSSGSICREGFDEQDARVICRMLNYRLVSLGVDTGFPKGGSE